METFVKPAWWGAFATHFGFSNDINQAEIPTTELLDTLTTHVSGNLTSLLSSSFKATQHVTEDTQSDPKKPAILIAPSGQASFVIGKLGSDYISGSSGADILYGDANNDYFVPNAGNDIVIGSPAMLNGEGDTVSYQTANAGIVVEYTANIPPAPPPPPYNNYYNASYYQWSAGTVQNITGFVTGAGGDVINVRDLLQQVGYTGADPIADGYIRLSDISSGLKIQFDPDGRGPTSARQAVILKGIYLANFSIEHNLEMFDSPQYPNTPPPHSSDYSIVSQDGHGGSDLLYSIENVIGSNFDDIIHGRDDSANLLYGGLGNDMLYGEGGNDTLIGGAGDDIVHGGNGNDFFIIGSGHDQFFGGDGIDMYKYVTDYFINASGSSHIFHDFTAGPGGDVINVSELLEAVHYSGIDPFAEGYFRLENGPSGANILFDPDGFGELGSFTLATLNGIDAANFSLYDNMITQQSSIILSTVLGQSNAAGLRVFDGDSDSGLSRLEAGLDSQTTYDQIYSVLKDENRQYLSVAVGGTVVNGDEEQDADLIWWYPSTNTPGELTIRASDMLITQTASMLSQGSLTPCMVWGQGESDAFVIGSADTEEARQAAQQLYYNATMSVFNYLFEHVDPNMQIYIMQTGNYHVGGAHAQGVTQSTIDDTLLGLTYIREAQQQMALNNKNIHLAINYADLEMLADLPPETPGYQPIWATDRWHLTYDSREIIGDRLADFIAQDLGFDHVLDNPGPYPMNMLSDLTIHAGTGVTIDGTENDNIITGTTGHDTIHGLAGVDAIVTGAGNDQIYGDAGEDILRGDAGDDLLNGGADADLLRGGTGADTFLFFPDFAFLAGDTIEDFSIAEGDRLDLRELLHTTFTGSITDFVQLSSDGLGNTLVLIDTDGTGSGYAPVQIATLTGVTGLPDVQTLINSGNILAPALQALRAGDDFFTMAEDGALSGNVLSDNGTGADRGPPGRTLSVTPGNFLTGTGAHVILNADGTFAYNPVANYHGPDSFTYTLSDGVTSISAVAYITVNSVNDNPQAQNDAFNFTFGQTVTGNILLNNGSGADSDVDLDTLSFTQPILASARGISVIIAPDGSFSFHAPSDFFGQDSFSYEVADGQGGFDTAVVTINVSAPAGATVGTENVDNMITQSGNDVIFGLGGDDVITSNNGNDRIYGGTGNDNILAGKGNDVSFGNDGNDVIKGNDGTDIMYGDDGIDQLWGENQNDTLYGGAGDDILRGGAHDDILEGGMGLDWLFGQTGNDKFVLNASALTALDIIKDFNMSEGDRISFEGLISGFDPLTQLITDFISTTTLSKNNTTLRIDLDGAGTDYTFQNVVTVQGFVTLNVQDLYNSGKILIS